MTGNITLIKIIIIFFYFCQVLYGTDYYVKTNGSNLSPGTSWASAWKTISYAASNVSAGDVVFVSNGIYKGAVNVMSNGSFGNLIKFQSVNPYQGIIDAEGAFYAMDLYQKAFIQIEGFVIKDATYGIRIYGNDNYIYNNYIVSNNTGIYSIENNRNIIYRNNISEVSFGIECKGITNCIIKSNLIYNNSYGIYFSPNDHCNISNYIIKNTIYSNSNYGIWLFCIAIPANIRNTHICSNNIYGENQDSGIYIFMSGQAIQYIYRNIIHNNEIYGININSSVIATNAKIINNTILGMGSDGIYISGSGGAEIYNNIIYQNAQYGIRNASSILYPVGYNNIFGNTSGSTNGGFIWLKGNVFGNPMINPEYPYEILSPYSASVDTGTNIPGISDVYQQAGPDMGWIESPYAIPPEVQNTDPDETEDSIAEFDDVRVFPNYIRSDIHQAEIWFKNSIQGFVHIYMIDATGKFTWQKTQYLPQGMQKELWIPDKNMGSGIYLVYVKDGSGIIRKGKILVVK